MNSIVFALAAALIVASTGAFATDDMTEARIDDAFRQVQVGMTMDEVEAIGQVGNHCTRWPEQHPPVCGILHYYQDRRTYTTAQGTVEVRTWDRRQIVFRNGKVVMVAR